MSITVTAVLSNACNFDCRSCIAGGPGPLYPMVDIDKMLKWLAEYFPKCNLHISGGEPLLIPGIYHILEKCINAGHDVTIFTNGSLIRENVLSTGLPIKWQVTHHPDFISTNDFLHQVELIKKRPHIVCRLRQGNDALNKTAETEALYNGYNFRWIVPNNGYVHYKCDNYEGSPCNKIIMIGTKGEVFPCSTIKSGEIGSIYDMSFDKNKADDFECRSCRPLNTCQAYQSSILMEEL